VSENLNSYVTWEGHRMNRRLEKDSIDSSHAYFSVAFSQRLFECLALFIPPPTHLFEVAGLCGSTGEFKTPRRSYPIHPSA
jgi:hypothetical protein